MNGPVLVNLLDVYLGLGSNIDPQENARRALELLRTQVKLFSVSSAWLTPAVGSSGPEFINAAIHIKTPLEANILKGTILRPIESSLGRVRNADKNAPRPIDLDILIYNGLVIDPGIWLYAHLAVPLAELLPELCNTSTGERLSDVASRLLNDSDCCLQPLHNYLSGSI